MKNLIDVTMENFESTVDEHPIVVLDFWAAWCAPCRQFAPIFEAASENNPDILFGKVDIENSSGLADAFQVRSVPTLMIFKKADLVFEQAGLVPLSLFEDLLKKVRQSEDSPKDQSS